MSRSGATGTSTALAPLSAVVTTLDNAPPLDQCLASLAFKRHFLNGTAGFIAARVHAFHAFLKYAKVLEAGRWGRR